VSEGESFMLVSVTQTSPYLVRIDSYIVNNISSKTWKNLTPLSHHPTTTSSTQLRVLLFLVVFHSRLDRILSEHGAVQLYRG
jgi:hypothetical protein